MLARVDFFERSYQVIYHIMLTKEASESIREIQANAALAGRDLGPFEPVEILTV